MGVRERAHNVLRQEIVSETETRLVVSGPLYSEAAEALERRLESLFRNNYQTITIDFSLALGITSSTLAQLILVQKRLREQKRTIRIIGCNDMLYSLFQKIKLHTIMEMTKESTPAAP